MKSIILVVFMAIAFFITPDIWAAGSCSVSCKGTATIKVDMTSRCMCVAGSACFTIDIGYMGRMMTTNGNGIMDDNVAGGKYRTLKGPGSTRYDGDAIRMGIPANDNHYKWIHKARNCGVKGGTEGGRTKTAGCVGVPCQHWPLVKSQVGKSLTICGANPLENSEGWNIVKGAKRGRIGQSASRIPADEGQTMRTIRNLNVQNSRGGTR